MKKYLTIFKISLEQEFVYRLNFVLWRVRNVLQIFLIFFLWDSVFSDPSRQFFSYDRTKIMTYVFGLVFVRSIVLSIRSIDVAGEISRGDVINYLLKPINYFKYWLTRDIASKTLNLSFALIEIIILYLLLKPQFYFQTNPVFLSLFLISLLSSVFLYFLLVFLFSQPTFWFPQQAWGFMFLLFVFSDLLGGGVFPLDILPQSIQNILFLTPFPHLLFIPVEIYLGKFGILRSFTFLATTLLWIFILILINKKIWEAGMKSFKAEGK